MALGTDFINDLKLRNNIENVVSSYVNLRRRGSNLVGLCPFHGEKTPSFTVYPETDSFYCFGCGTGGDVIEFVRKIENLDYYESVKLLAQRAGIELPKDGMDDSVSKLRTRLFEANREAARHFYKMLFSDEGKSALDYLLGRGITLSTIKRFGIGYAPDSWDMLIKHMKSKGFTLSELQMADLSIKSKNGKSYDKFRCRVIFPIIDLRGNVIGFGGRAMDSSPAKYINTSDTVIFKKSSNLFALNFAKNSKEDSLILAEGYMDVIALHQAGFTNAVATLGTALTQGQASLLSRYASEIVIAYDADEAGQKATARAMNIFKNSPLKVRVLTLPGSKDPDEYIKKKGADSFRKLLESSKNDIEYKLHKLKENFNVEALDGRVSYLKEAVNILADVADPIEQDIYASKLSNELNVEKGAIMLQIDYRKKRKMSNSSRNQINKINKALINKKAKVDSQSIRYPKAVAAEEAIIAILIRNPELYKLFNQKIKAQDFVTDFNKRVFCTICDKIRDGAFSGITSLYDDFTQEEVAVVSGVIAKNSQLIANEEEIENLIKTLISEKDRVNITKEASNQEILEYTKRLLSRKNKGVQ